MGKIMGGLHRSLTGMDDFIETGDEVELTLRVLAGSVRLMTRYTLAGQDIAAWRDMTTFRGQPLADVVRRDMLRETHMAAQLAVKYAPRPLW